MTCDSCNSKKICKLFDIKQQFKEVDIRIVFCPYKETRADIQTQQKLFTPEEINGRSARIQNLTKKSQIDAPQTVQSLKNSNIILEVEG